jgi:hypothetical protein
MAVKGSGTKPMGPPMQDQTTGYDARSGAAKKPQKTFPLTHGMKDMTKMSGIAPSNPGTGPDASSPNPLDPEPPIKRMVRQPATLEAKWGMKTGDGKGLDNSGPAVMSEAVLSGSSKLRERPPIKGSIPKAPSMKTDSGKAPKPWPARDPN